MPSEQPDPTPMLSVDKVVRPARLGLVTALVIAGHVLRGEPPRAPMLPGSVRAEQPTPVPDAKPSR